MQWITWWYPKTSTDEFSFSSPGISRHLKCSKSTDYIPKFRLTSLLITFLGVLFIKDIVNRKDYQSHAILLCPTKKFPQHNEKIKFNLHIFEAKIQTKHTHTKKINNWWWLSRPFRTFKYVVIDRVFVIWTLIKSSFHPSFC